MTEPHAPHRPQPPWQLPPPPRKKGLSTAAIVWIVVGSIAAVGGLLLMLAVAFAASSPPGSGIKDVEITYCGSTDAGNARAGLQVTNSTNRVQDYRITVAFLDSSNTQLATGFAFVQDLSPGQSAIDDAIGLLSRGEGHVAKCRVTRVTRS